MQFAGMRITKNRAIARFFYCLALSALLCGYEQDAELMPKSERKHYKTTLRLPQKKRDLQKPLEILS